MSRHGVPGGASAIGGIGGGDPRRINGAGSLVGDASALVDAHRLNFRPSIVDLPEEHHLTIEVNGRTAGIVPCSPSGAKELAVGWAFARRLLDDASEIRRATAHRDRVSIMLDRVAASDPDLSTSRDGLGGVAESQARSGPETIVPDRDRGFLTRGEFASILDRLQQRLHQDGAVDLPVAAIAGADGTCVLARDLDLVNAVDKVIGWTILEAIVRLRFVLYLSGRITAAAVQRVERAGIPIVVSPLLPTCEAVELGHRAGIALVSGLGTAEAKVYAHGWRISANDAAE